MPSSTRDLPSYDHDDPERTFDALDRHIRRYLDVAIPTGHVRLEVIPAEPRQAGPKEEVLVPAEAGAADSAFRCARVEDTRCLSQDAEWFLGIRSSGSAAEVIAKAPRVVKICASRYVVRIVKEAYPGLELEHVPSPPAALAPRIGTTYFRILRSEPCWKTITESKDVGLYVPSAIGGAELELVVVLTE